MKLQTQFTVPKKDLKDLDYVRKNANFRKNFKTKLYRLSI